jgi:nucleoside-diphosphate-sugar epimerase
MARLVVYGAGELGGRVARRWHGDVLAVTRTTARHAALAAEGIDATTTPPELRADDHVLLATNGSANQAEVAEALVGDVARAVLISSTGIYGTERTGFVDVRTPPGDTDRARAVLAAEAAFRQWAPDGVVLRCGGLYRQGRGPLSGLLRRGTAPAGPPDRTLALVHYDDAATAALGALQHPAPEATYLVVGPDNPTREAFYTTAATLHGLEPVTFTEPVGAARTYDLSATERDLIGSWEHPDWRDATL